MDVVIMGSGVIGVTSAYMLAKDGHKVKVIDCASQPAQGSSFANGAQLSFSHIEPLSSPHCLKQMAKALINPKSFLFLDSIDKKFLSFVSQLIKNSGKKNTLRIAKNIFTINKLSKKTLKNILSDEKIQFDYSKTGILHIFRNEKFFENAKNFAKFQNSIGAKSEIFNLTECLEKEPTLLKIIDSKTLKGGIFHSQDASGNPYLFTNALAKICTEKYGVEFIFNEKIKNILTDSKTITGLNCQSGVYKADSYVYCLGSPGLSLLEGVNIDTKIFPVTGSSISIESNKKDISPKISITDQENKMVYSKIGNIFRAAGAILINKSNNSDAKMQKFIKSKITETFSDYGNIEKTTNWHNQRLLRPDSIPLICNVKKYGNLYLNTVHGHLGWTMSCGSAEIIRRLIKKEDMSEFSFLDKIF